MLVVINAGLGNLRSLEKALKKIGANFLVTSNSAEIAKASHVILPGVGHFKKGITKLQELGFQEALEKFVQTGKPLLGICLGMQLLFKRSEEGDVEGLGFIEGEVKHFVFTEEEKKVPHIGWNDVFQEHLEENFLYKDIKNNSNFYFVHSYYAQLNEKVPHTLTEYGNNFVSSVQKGMIFGTQFHPEKSQKPGLQLLKNFIALEGE